MSQTIVFQPRKVTVFQLEKKNTAKVICESFSSTLYPLAEETAKKKKHCQGIFTRT